MSKHANEPETVTDFAEMNEKELNAYSAKALKRLAIRTAVGIAIGAAIGVALSTLISTLGDDEDESTDSESTTD